MHVGLGPVDLPLVIGALDRDATRPLHQQLYERSRLAILAGRLAAGTRLPSSRWLQAAMGISRGTVMLAFEQLIAEGYLESRVGAGTYVSNSLPELLLAPPSVRRARAGRALHQVSTSARGRRLVAASRLRPGHFVAPRLLVQAPPFTIGVPAIDELDFEVWGRLASRNFSNPPRALLGYAEPGGYEPLREAVASHLVATRAVSATAEQVMIVSGSQQALDSIARVILDPGDLAAVEDPGYPGARSALVAAGARLQAVPVDGGGLDLGWMQRQVEAPRLLHVTPSYQTPLGSTMGLERRLELLRFAAEREMWILEDDYGSEYRYSGRPVPSLQGLDDQGRVVYVGTFSTVLNPGLRLGYLVAPPHLLQTLLAARWLSDQQPPGVIQAVMADFIIEGHFGRHVRRMRTLYAERQQRLLELGQRYWGDCLRLAPADSGMHLVGYLPPGSDDVAAARLLGTQGIVAAPLSSFVVENRQPPGLVLGYAPWGFAEAAEAVRRGADLLRRA